MLVSFPMNYLFKNPRHMEDFRFGYQRVKNQINELK